MMDERPRWVVIPSTSFTGDGGPNWSAIRVETTKLAVYNNEADALAALERQEGFVARIIAYSEQQLLVRSY